MKTILEYAKCVAFVLLAPAGFVFLWELFGGAVNPYLAALIVEGHVKQSPLHRFTLNTLDLIANHPIRLWWGIAAFVFFCWAVQKKDQRRHLRRVGMAVFLTPYVALTLLVIAASLIQGNA